jgi:hypothetical protein
MHSFIEIEIEIGIEIEIAPLIATDALINRSKRRQARASRGPVSCRVDPDSDPDFDGDCVPVIFIDAKGRHRIA